jgi:hypothetical protein
MTKIYLCCHKEYKCAGSLADICNYLNKIVPLCEICGIVATATGPKGFISRCCFHSENQKSASFEKLFRVCAGKEENRVVVSNGGVFFSTTIERLNELQNKGLARWVVREGPEKSVGEGESYDDILMFYPKKVWNYFTFRRRVTKQQQVGPWKISKERMEDLNFNDIYLL